MKRRQFLVSTLAAPFVWESSARVFASKIAPNATQLGASTACLAGLSLLESITEIQRLGFATIEILAFANARHSLGTIPGFWFHRMNNRDREQLFNATRSFAHISAHMPFHDLHLFSFNEDVRSFGVDQIKKGMDGLAFLKGEMAVVHVGALGNQFTYKEVWRQMLDTLRSLGDYAAERNLRIGLETMWPESIQEYTDLMFDVNHPNVGATIDTGHIRSCTDINLPPERRDSAEGRQRYNDVLMKIVDTLGKKLLHFHLDDVRSSDWREHRALGTGIVDFPRLAGTLKKTQFTGLLIFELEEPDRINSLKSSAALMKQLM